MLPAMNLPRRFRSFSLRTLMVLVTACALAAWWWTLVRYGTERRLQAALIAIWRENPRANILVHRSDEDCQVFVRNVDQLSATTAKLIARAEFIRRIRLRASSDDGMLRTIRVDPNTGDALREGYGKVFDGSFEISCERRPVDPSLVRLSDDFDEWERPFWIRENRYKHELELQRPPAP
jgi:hypothetical protein